MSKGRYEKAAQRHFPFGVIISALLVLILIALLLHNCGKTPEASSDSTVPETTVEKNEGSISIPGFEMLELQAESQQQTICLYNPAQNNCYFEISLYLEDGTLLWKSELIEPGKTSEPLMLSQELKKGYYPKSVLRYACYRMDESLTPLNGAETKVTLWVK